MSTSRSGNRGPYQNTQLSSKWSTDALKRGGVLQQKDNERHTPLSFVHIVTKRHFSAVFGFYTKEQNDINKCQQGNNTYNNKNSDARVAENTNDVINKTTTLM